MQSLIDTNFNNIPFGSTIVLNKFDSKFGHIPNMIIGKLLEVKIKDSGEVISLIIDDKSYDLSNNEIRIKSSFWIMEQSNNENFVQITNDKKYDSLCVDGNCIVCLNSGNIIFVKDIKKGQQVLLENSSFGTVKCIVKSYADFLFSIGSLSITPYHPIKLNGIWTYPIDHENDENVYSITSYEKIPVYSILLEEPTNLGIMINDIPVASLGHFSKDEIRNNHSIICNTLESLNNEDFNKGLIKVDRTFTPLHI